jgi:alkanesulfonate monooxygenase SsuD/methylene tetrahydromethanopterin reductase-like flavin-dependent oxidoreductase (luciferase family)
VSDYGHALPFGAFLTPDARHADRVVQLAALTEAAGLDLVTVQDHPYSSRLLDVWALLAVNACSLETAGEVRRVLMRREPTPQVS